MQKEAFLESEGDAWFERNRVAINNRNYQSGDLIVESVIRCVSPRGSDQTGDVNLLEIGCGDGKRLKYLQERIGINCYGVEPSNKALTEALKLGVSVSKATADNLPYPDKTFDILVFGFCLYLCDRDDLFKIANEANRVLKSTGWLIIHDFYSIIPNKTKYRHLEGIYSFKMDYRRLFDWHPDYTCITHTVNAHNSDTFNDNPDEWVATSVLRKKSRI